MIKYLILLTCYKLFDCIDHILQLLLRHSWVDTKPETVGHDMVGNGQVTDDTIVLAFLILFESRMLQQVASKEVSGLYLMILEIACQLITCKAGIIFHGNEESEPTRTTILLRLWQE